MITSTADENRRWRIAKLGDICEKITDGTHHSPPNGPTGDFKYVTAKNIRPSGLDLTEITYVDTATHREIYSRCDVRKDDILYVKDGATTGRVALNALDEEFSLLSSVGVLRPNRKYILPKYLLYALQAPAVKHRMLADVAGVAITRLTLKKLKAAEVPVAPLDQQGAIVAELEKQFSRLDEVVANLQRVKGNLKRYKAAVLTAAVEGRLVPTEAELARRHGRSFESGAALVDRIRDARRRMWTGRGKYKEPAAMDGASLPDVAEGWASTSLDGLSWDSGYGTSAKCSHESKGVAVLRIPNVQHGAIDLHDLKFAPPDLSVPSSELLDAGDMLVIRTNGSKALIGRAAVVSEKPTRPLAFASYLIRFRLCAGEGVGQWVNTVWAESRIRTWIEARAATSAGQHNISQSVLATAPIPIPPTAEQGRIVAEVDRRLSIVREVQAEVDANLKRAQVLRQAVLARVFAG